ncbi:hypothetical protein KFL_003720030 [Klebsormidium nitens]|uniref:Uncharacterized protein n=1 Tax=Klebsormidium nitens TaxID=105231 RepID=A0A1Y1ICP0_KLENI|nr:hypothetical protein KFL_003720030 [Klebsormidium nitens]|eukprot:GAQ87712.1 hypothetical protein KFL_003720030 [Klebsormidium nitens]
MGVFSAMKRTLSKSPKQDNVPEKLEKDMAPDLPVKVQPEETSQLEKNFHSEKTLEKKAAASPSVVVPWILNEVSECDISELFDCRVQMKVHAARLLDCWRAHEAEFPRAFARGLLQVLQGFDQDNAGSSKKIKSLACFLVHLFDGKDSAVHIRNGKEELWTLVLPELGRIELDRGKDWTSNAESRSREETSELLTAIGNHGRTCVVQTCALCGEQLGRHSNSLVDAAYELQNKIYKMNVQARTPRKKATELETEEALTLKIVF